jgi:hypothetical protein
MLTHMIPCGGFICGRHVSLLNMLHMYTYAFSSLTTILRTVIILRDNKDTCLKKRKMGSDPHSIPTSGSPSKLSCACSVTFLGKVIREEGTSLIVQLHNGQPFTRGSIRKMGRSWYTQSELIIDKKAASDS